LATPRDISALCSSHVPAGACSAFMSSMGKLMGWFAAGSKLLMRRPFLSAVAGLGALLLIANLPLVLGLRKPRWDSDEFFAPAQMLVADHARAGQLLLWNPWTNAGSPDGVDPQYGAFSPLMVGYSVLAGGSAVAFRWYFLLTWFAGGCGMLILLQHLRVPLWASFLGASSFMFSGFFLGHASHTSFIHAYAALPWIIWRLDAALGDRSLWTAAQAGAIWGLSALAGYPGVVVANAGLMLLWAAGRSQFGVRNAERGTMVGTPHSALRTPHFAYALSTLLVAFLIGGAVLCPTYLAFLVEGRGVSDRAGALPRNEAVGDNALHPAALASIASPHVPMHKLTAREPLWPGNDVSSMSVYVGALVAWLALLAPLLQWRSFERWWLLAIGLLGLGLALGQSLPLRGWLYDAFPPARFFRHASIFRGYFIFVAPILAGWACKDLHELIRGRSTQPGLSFLPSWRLWAVTGSLLAVAAVGGYFALVASLPLHPDQLVAHLHAGLSWLVVATMALVGIRLMYARCPAALPPAIVGLLILDLMVACQLSRHTVASKVTAETGAAWRLIAANRVTDLDLTPRGLARIAFTPFGALMDNKNLPLKTPVFSGYQPFRHRLHQAWANDAVMRSAAVAERRIWFATIDEAAEVPPTNVAFDAYRARFHQLGALPLVIHRPEHMVAGCQAGAGEPDSQAAEVIAKLPPAQALDVHLECYQPNELVFDAVAPQRGYLLVTDRWSPGWTASINDKAADVLGGAFIFRAVAVEPGPNRVCFRYRPFGFPWTLILSWSTLAIVLCAPLMAHLHSVTRPRAK
jgi:hypothetical protein